MELVEKTESLRRLSFYALTKFNLDRYRSFRKILLILFWDINLNPGLVHGMKSALYSEYNQCGYYWNK